MTSKAQRSLFANLGLLAVSLAMVNPYFAKSQDFWAVYSVKVGEALFVGGVVSLVMDRFLKAELFTEIARDVLQFTIGYELPKQVQDEIRYLVRLPFVRRNFEMALFIEPIENHPGYVSVRMDTNFQVENLAKVSLEYEFTSSIQVCPYADVRESSIDRIEADGHVLEGQALIEKTEVDPHFRQVHQSVKIPEHAADRRIPFSTVRTTVFRERDVYVLDILEPTIDVTIRMITPDDLTSDVYFPSRIRGTTKRSHPQRPTVFVHHGVFLPGQFIRIRWSRS